MALEFSQTVAALNGLRLVISTLITKKADEHSRDIFEREFSSRELSERQQRELDRLWDTLHDFVIDEMTKRLSAQLDGREETAYIELALSALNDFIRSNSMNTEQMGRYLEQPRDFVSRIVERESVRLKMSSSEASVFRVALSTFMEAFSEIFFHVPIFKNDSSRFFLVSLREIAGQLHDVEHRLASIDRSVAEVRSQDHIQYERLYRRSLADTLDNLPIVGLSTDSEIPDLPITVGYVDVNLTDDIRLNFRQPLLLSGHAGQGKTSFLKFVVTHSAINRVHTSMLSSLGANGGSRPLFDHIARNPNIVPFFVRLRDHKEITLDSLCHAAARAGTPPEHWVRGVLDKRATIVIFDGIDEVTAELRRQTEETIRLLMTFPKCLVIVSGRPLAIDYFNRSKGWPVVKISGLSADQQLRLVARWFAHARRFSFLKRAKEIEAIQSRLSALLSTDRAISSIASSPLVCSAICLLSLNYKSGLPNKLYWVCDALAKMMMAGRDKENGIIFRDPTGRDVVVGAVEVHFLLKVISGRMIRDARSVLEIEEVQNQLNATNLVPDNFLLSPMLIQALVERVGLLRYAGDASLEFNHNVFKEYFAVDEVLSDFSASDLRSSVHDEAVRNVLLMACETTQIDRIVAQIDTLLREVRPLIEGVDSRRFDLFLLSCIYSVPFSRPGWNDVRRSLEDGFIPPEGPDESSVLARATTGVAARLKYSHLLTEEQLIYSVRTLGLMDDDAAPAFLEEYSACKNQQVLDELVRYLNPLAIERYCRELLETGRLPSPLMDRVTSLSPILQAKYAMTRVLNVAGSSVYNLDGIEAFEELEEFYASGTLINDVVPLARCRKLRIIILDFCPIEDVSALFTLPDLENLSLDYTRIESLPQENIPPRLRILNIRRTLVPDQSLAAFRSVQVGTEI